MEFLFNRLKLTGIKFPKPPKLPTSGILTQPIAAVHGTNKMAGSTVPRSNIPARLGISTRFGGRGGNARSAGGGR